MRKTVKMGASILKKTRKAKANAKGTGPCDKAANTYNQFEKEYEKSAAYKA